MIDTPKNEKFDTVNQARKVLGLPYLKDKAICLISSWERTRITHYMPAEDDEKEYIFEEMSLYERAFRDMQEHADFSFLAFREFSDDIEWEDIDFEEIEKTKKNFQAKPPKVKNIIDTKTKEEFVETASFEHGLSKFLSRKSIAYLKYQQKTKDMVGHYVTVLPRNDTSIQYVKLLRKEEGLPELHNIDILCIDYSKFPYFVLTHFIKYMKTAYQKDKPPISQELLPLYRLFSKVSSDVKIVAYCWLQKWIDDAYKNNMDVRAWDEIEFASMSHVQNIQTPYFWKGTYRDGYLCEGNKENIIEEPPKDRQDFRFFYSFEALLLYELKSCLKRIKRCNNCGAIMTSRDIRYKGRYCPKSSSNYAKCNAERNRKRQQKHYNLTKI